MPDAKTLYIDLEKGTYELPKVPDGVPDLANETLGTVRVPLRVPFSFRGVYYDHVSLRVPSGADFRKYLDIARSGRDPSTHDWLLIVFDAPREIAEVMHAADYVECLNLASSLLKPD